MTIYPRNKDNIREIDILSYDVQSKCDAIIRIISDFWTIEKAKNEELEEMIRAVFGLHISVARCYKASFVLYYRTVRLGK